jgi:hypothetical protein
MTEKIIIHGSSSTEHVTEHRPLRGRHPGTVVLDLGFEQKTVENWVKEPWVQAAGTTAPAVLRRLDRSATPLAALVSAARDTPGERKVVDKRRAAYARKNKIEITPVLVPLRVAQENINLLYQHRAAALDLDALNTEHYGERAESAQKIKELTEQHRAAVQESSELTRKVLDLIMEKQALEEQVAGLQEALNAWEELGPVLGELRILSKWLAVSPEAEELEPGLEQELRTVLGSFSETFKRTSETLKKRSKGAWSTIQGTLEGALHTAAAIGQIYRTYASGRNQEPETP